MSKSEDTLEEVANLVYYGGLDGLTENDALEQIRELVYPWLKTGWRRKNEIGKAGYPLEQKRNPLAHP